MVGQCFQRIALASVWGILPVVGEERRGAAGTPVGGCYRSVWHVNMACTEMPVVQNVRCGWIQDVFEVG